MEGVGKMKRGRRKKRKGHCLTANLHFRVNCTFGGKYEATEESESNQVRRLLQVGEFHLKTSRAPPSAASTSFIASKLLSPRLNLISGVYLNLMHLCPSCVCDIVSVMR